MDRNPPANAGDTGSIPGLGRFCMLWSNYVHVLQLLSLWALEPVPLNKRSHRNEKPLHHDWKVTPVHCNLRKPTRGNEDPVQPKIKIH